MTSITLRDPGTGGLENEGLPLKTNRERGKAHMLLFLPVKLLLLAFYANAYTPTEVPSNVAAIEAHNVGAACLPTKDFQCAIDAFTQAVTIEPTFYRAWQNLALTYDYTSRHIEAHAAHQEALHLGYYFHFCAYSCVYSCP